MTPHFQGKQVRAISPMLDFRQRVLNRVRCRRMSPIQYYSNVLDALSSLHFSCPCIAHLLNLSHVDLARYGGGHIVEDQFLPVHEQASS